MRHLLHFLCASVQVVCSSNDTQSHYRKHSHDGVQLLSVFGCFLLCCSVSIVVVTGSIHSGRSHHRVTVIRDCICRAQCVTSRIEHAPTLRYRQTNTWIGKSIRVSICSRSSASIIGGVIGITPH